MNDAEMVDEFAKSLAEFDGYMIVETNPMAVGGWEPRMEPSWSGELKSREAYEQEARRFLHCFEVALNILRR